MTAAHVQPEAPVEVCWLLDVRRYGHRDGERASRRGRVMSTSATARTWTATIAYGDQITFPCWTSRETVTADLSENDLQRDQAYVAQLEATQYLLAGAATSAYVQLHKTTKSGTRNDRGFAMDLWDAEIFALRHATRRSTQITPRPVMPHPDERVLFGSTTTNRELRDALRKDKS